MPAPTWTFWWWPALPSPPLERIGLVPELLQDVPVPVDALVLTPEELAERREFPFLRKALRKAVPLYPQKGAGGSGPPAFPPGGMHGEPVTDPNPGAGEEA